MTIRRNTALFASLLIAITIIPLPGLAQGAFPRDGNEGTSTADTADEALVTFTVAGPPPVQGSVGCRFSRTDPPAELVPGQKFDIEVSAVETSREWPANAFMIGEIAFETGVLVTAGRAHIEEILRAGSVPRIIGQQYWADSRASRQLALMRSTYTGYLFGEREAGNVWVKHGEFLFDDLVPGSIPDATTLAIPPANIPGERLLIVIYVSALNGFVYRDHNFVYEEAVGPEGPVWRLIQHFVTELTNWADAESGLAANLRSIEANIQGGNPESSSRYISESLEPAAPGSSAASAAAPAAAPTTPSAPITPGAKTPGSATPGATTPIKPADAAPWVFTESGEEYGSKVANIVQGQIQPSKKTGKVTYDAATMWHSAKSPTGWVAVQVAFPHEVELTRLAVHSQHSGEYHSAQAVRVSVRDTEGRFQRVTDADLRSVDAVVDLPKTKGRVWRFEFLAGASGYVVLRGLQFFSGDEELFPTLGMTGQVDSVAMPGTNLVGTTEFPRRQSEEPSDAQAQFELALRYAKGEGVAKDAAEAVTWYRKAAEQGNASAQSSLGYCYVMGTGVEKDAVEAVKWFRKAAEQGYAIAQESLGDCYSTGEGVAKDAAEAVTWYRKAAEQGYVVAQKSLGYCYAMGTGVGKDAAEAVKWWRKAAEQGNVDARKSLAETKSTGVAPAKE